MTAKKIVILISMFALCINYTLSQGNLNPGLKLHDQNLGRKLTGSVKLPSEFYSGLNSQIVTINKDVDKSRLLLESPKNDLLVDSHKFDQVKPKEKSPWIGAGLSVLVPGAGEFYAKSYIKAAIFFAIEVGIWSTYFYFEHTGNTKTTDYQNYADKYWNVRYYAQWLNDNFQAGLDPNDPDLEHLRTVQINPFIQGRFSHTLPEYGSQQYYELIGKYQEFQGGWMNLNNVPVNNQNSQFYWETYRDPTVVNYMTNRQDANNYYDKASTMGMVAIVNHLLSAADAAWSVTIFNKNLKVQTGLRIIPYYTPVTLEEKTLPTFNVRLNF